MDQYYIEMGRRIKNRRNELKIKQNELAEFLNISTNHMSSIETGKQKPSMDVFIQICKKLQVTPDYLLPGCMRAGNISQNIIDKLNLCSYDDLQLAQQFIELLVERNKTAWNQAHFI